MEKENIILVGAGQQANVVMYNVIEQGKYKICAVLDVNKTLWGEFYNGVYVEEGYQDYDRDYLEYIKKKYCTNKFFIGIGSMKLRYKIFDYFIADGWEPVNIIHPSAIVSSATNIGKGVLIEAGCLVTPNPIIGNNVVINTGSQVNHDNIIEDNVYIASGVILSGGVKIGNNTLLDDGVIISLKRTIGNNCIIGAGAVVTKDIPDNRIAYGNPCKIIRNNL
jgi:sugar O-acyltransferase (sialic acid O-acetyltransferase NeuD family)